MCSIQVQALQLIMNIHELRKKKVLHLGLNSYLMEQHTSKNVNNCLDTNIYSYLETSNGQSSNSYLNAVHFFNTRVKKKSVAA